MDITRYVLNLLKSRNCEDEIMKYVYLILGLIVFFSGIYCLYLFFNPTGFSSNKMNLIGGLILVVLGGLLFFKIVKK